MAEGLKCQGPLDGIVENIAVFVTDKQVFIVNRRAEIVRINRLASCDCRLLAHTGDWRLFYVWSKPEPGILTVVECGCIP